MQETHSPTGPTNSLPDEPRLAVGVTAFGLGGAQQVRTEPPDPREHGC
jgi:hypothetical protein